MCVFGDSNIGKGMISIIIIIVAVLLVLTYNLGKIDGNNEYRKTIFSSVDIASVSEIEQEIKKKNIIIMNLVRQNNEQNEIIKDLFKTIGFDPNQ